MKIILLLLCLLPGGIAIGQGQLSPNIVELPTASLEEAGLNRDSIENLIGLIQTSPRKDFSGKPGEKWVYADISAVLIGLAIEEASGMSLKDYAQEKLFTPLGINQVYWYTNAANQTGAAGNLYLSTLDFAKLGLVVVNEGSYNGRQFMDPAYVKELVDHKNFDLSPFADAYGMLWYKSTKMVNGKPLDYVFASGNGGNHLIVIPEKEMIVALTSSAYGPGHGQGRSLTILSMILAALEE